MKNSRLGLLYLGRLEQEKGFKLILEAIKNIEGDLPFDLYVFGKGSLEKDLLDQQRTKSQIHFFGWKRLEEIKRYLENIDYCLMPSLCLETFGLSAVNVLDRGIPVVGFKKGGIAPFILENYDISTCDGNSELKQFETMLEKLILEKKNQNSDFFSQLSLKCKNIAQNYTKEQWFSQFKSLTSHIKGKRILLVSDFINPIGGIETYLHEVKTLLTSKGYQVQLFGSQCSSGFWGIIQKYLGLGISIGNLREAIRLHRLLKKETPDLIWLHSMLRREGRLPVVVASKQSAPIRMMYHDLGYFHPFPSKIGNEKEIKSLSLANFLRMTKSWNPFTLLLAIGRRLSLRLLIFSLKKSCDKHLVPSDFMQDILYKSLKIDAKKIQTFSHFVQK